MVIYTYPKSRSLRVLWTLEELGVNYESIKADILCETPAVASPHPRGKVPFLVDGDVSVCETLAICTYICEKYAGSTLYPTDPARRAAINSWISFALTDLESPVWNLLKQLLFVPEAQRAAPLLEYFRAGATQAVAMATPAHHTPWIAGDDFTLADIFMTHTLLWAKLCGIALGEQHEDYLTRAFARPAFLSAQQRNNQ
ncbi:glutathione S-transferase family protein [Cronobacter muytjensii]|uniref:Glutathione S-transferase family protein n=1 Tax=Cronobacter muytjensii TaxID=413501 RepID=A0A2T7AJS8_9ENTR|nr:glutathione S-transferase family protein [Cronobacter muytjensii]KAB0876164.1 glutathione S-transferase family protein [Cronobacter muytjensii]MBF4812484.1 glutathione S-transferase family protein [Cronobacter muytjensii]PUX08597.1 glutathione S-transferase family protein [Cronobacter muytjensii]